jgi:hypothetical protein
MAGKAARQADGGHAGLGTGADEAQLFDRGKAAPDEFGEIAFVAVGGSEAGSARGGLLNRLDHRGEGVAQDHGAPGAEAVEVAVAVGIPQPRSGGALDEGRIAADRAERPHRRIHTTGQQTRRPHLQLP